METQKVYEKTLIKLDGVGTNNIALDKSRFVLTANEAQNKIIEHFLSNKTDENLRYIQQILVDKKIQSSGVENNLYSKVLLPEDYFDFSSVIGYGTKGMCNNKQINLYEIKDPNKDEILIDEFNKPSFLYREAPFVVSQDMLKIYTMEEFVLDNVILNYYRYPIQIRQVDPDDPESAFDDTVEIEFDDKLVDRIISEIVSEIQLNNKESVFQQNKIRAQQKL